MTKEIQTTNLNIQRRRQVEARTGLSRSTLYLYISQGLFPRPINLGPRSIGWPDYEIDAINAARIAGKSDEEIRALVARLVAARKTMA
ncbi:AlpA family phage regulatory protein [Nitrosomonas sp.]|uniref:helix-turn-helix transcriptional regulator n=1 Tax=Nitrosomonas sp. TaxID=42353 RepID=UPI0025E6B85B|nr:AlpA family phage regulatory protein [Nitrosomonas sp.]